MLEMTMRIYLNATDIIENASVEIMNRLCKIINCIFDHILQKNGRRLFPVLL